MASPCGSSNISVKSKLESEPYRFSFVQSVRLLQQTNANPHDGSGEVGTDALPEDESVRLAALPARSFPTAEVASLLTVKRSGESEHKLPKLLVTFMGLFGPCGVLPQHDTQRVIDGGHQKNPERDLLDLFNHRLLSLYYRAATKYRVPFSYERNYRSASPDSKRDDIVTSALYAIAGLGFEGLRSRLDVKDEVAIEYSGILGHSPKNAVSLQRMLQAYFNLPIEIQQFTGQWLTLSAENKSTMPERTSTWGQNCELGKKFILGERTWDVSGKYRVRIGPLSRQQFNRLLPGQPDLEKIAQVAQLYTGQQFDFDIQLELMARDVPSASLDGHSRLGANTWIFGSQPVSNKTEAVFRQSGLPIDATGCGTANVG